MVEMGRADEAVQFATAELELSQQLVDRLSSAVGEPALVALLLGKTAQADERGIELTVTEDTHLPAERRRSPADGQEMVTVLGNLIDNAMDACDRDGSVGGGDGQPGRRRTADPGGRQRRGHGHRHVREGHATRLLDEVGQPTPGSTGSGLALVAQVVKRHDGTADRRRDVRLAS